MKIHVLHCGYIQIAKDLLRSGGRFSAEIGGAALASRRSRVTLPVCAYLIEHRTGLYLVDTGWSREISPSGEFSRKAAESVLPKHQAAMYRPFVPTGMTASEQLAQMGISPQDLDAVIITHFDADHVSGLRSLSGARRIIVPEDEAYWSVRTRYRMRQVRELWESVSYERLFYRGAQLGPYKRAIDISGDGSVMMVSLAGHTDGQAGVIVREAGRYVLLAADAAVSAQNWEEMAPPGLGAEKGMQMKTLEWIAGVAKDPACAAVLCSHDPGVEPGVLEVE